MKFSDLKFLFSLEIEKIKNDGENSNLEKTKRFIILAYKNVLKKITDLFADNENATEKRINQLDITQHMKEKLTNMSKQTIPKSLKDKQQNNKLKTELNNLLGIGEKKAQELIEEGLTNIKQLHNKKWLSKLNTDSQIILEHNPIRYISHEDINKIEKKICGFDNHIVITGSYRRNKPYSRDIDILFMNKEAKVSKDPKKTKEPRDSKIQNIDSYLDYLKSQFDNKLWIYAKGNDKVSMVIEVEANMKYKCDIFISDEDNYYSNLLYTTGSKEHNIKMRSRAKRMGYLLNQNGLFQNGKKIILKPGEKSFFDVLKMTYLEPSERF